MRSSWYHVGTHVSRSRAALLVAAALLAPSVATAQSPAPRDISCGEAVLDSSTTGAVRPTRVSGPAPVYPEVLRQEGTSGVVRLQFVVDCAGRVDSTSIRVVRSPDERFSRAAMLAVQHTRFRPATLEGRPVMYRMEQNIRFAVR